MSGLRKYTLKDIEEQLNKLFEWREQMKNKPSPFKASSTGKSIINILEQNQNFLDQIQLIKKFLIETNFYAQLFKARDEMTVLQGRNYELLHQIVQLRMNKEKDRKFPKQIQQINFKQKKRQYLCKLSSQ